MNWKQELRLSDMPPETPLEVFCSSCGHSGFYSAQALQSRSEFDGAYLDQVEASLRCKRPACHGRVTLYEVLAGETEAFDGGMP